MNIIFNKKFITITAIAVITLMIVIFCTIAVGKTSAENGIESETIINTETETETDIITETETETELVSETETEIIIETEIETETEEIIIIETEEIVVEETTEYIPPVVEEVVEPETTQSLPIGTYPIAEYVWNYLHSAGLNDYVTAGIIGNMMAECGGLTLDLQWNIYNADGSCYGLCQWLYQYYPETYGASLETQLEYLINTLEYNFSLFSNNYYYGFTYQNFLNLNNCEEAAIAFARVYERCGSAYVALRAELATIAYKYFCD